MSKFAWNRRNFLKIAGLTGLGLGAGLTGKIVNAQTSPDGTGAGMGNMPGMDATAAPTAPAAAQGFDNEAMDKMMEDGVKYFLANAGKDKEFWGVDMPFTMDGDTKVFQVTCSEGPWEVSPGQTVNAMMYNARVPGPIMRVT